MRLTMFVAALALTAGVTEAQSGASIRGRVLVKGTPPGPQRVKVSGDAHCKSQHPEGLDRLEFRVSNGGLAEALVYLKSGVEGAHAPTASPALLDQKGCTYLPGLVALQVGQPLKIRNSDPTLHNVHFRPKLNPEINIGQPRAGMEATRTFAKPELMVPIGCDVHPWMRAHLAVLEHPFFGVSGEGGGFEIGRVPPGSYELEARHPKLKPVSAKVEVGAAGAALDLTLEFGP